jgi:hypothetical protein
VDFYGTMTLNPHDRTATAITTTAITIVFNTFTVAGVDTMCMIMLSHELNSLLRLNYKLAWLNMIILYNGKADFKSSTRNSVTALSLLVS